ncbi:FMN-binding glutamate synthase family protein [Larkinella rosea]|uniref:FMN-binding glutamate synthase family protein n=1 Tax=Larkinella rosea TaxID=2025312 RepID=A0A3P1BZY4_9BACT|nr:FMN-binding glutamate synthase family protein [Larkinella rosea]RRB06572.1 FMN-binding glutamate synthase family protein [Larkinella rosea]
MELVFTTLGNIPWWGWILIGLALVALYDINQKKHTIRHNFPVVGNLRYFLESFGPELRQYIVANNREELPFNRQQRAWIYSSSKQENNFQGFGTDQDITSAGYIFINPALLPLKLAPDNPNYGHPYTAPAAKVIGVFHKRRRPYHPRSIVNISGMSFGSLSAKAIESMNKGALKFGCYHNTGEGGLSSYHKFGADVVVNIGTSYFGVRDDEGNFLMEKLVKLVEDNPFVRMLELKLSQGAKPGKGGVLPAAKITAEISEIRHVPMGRDVISPASHSAFSDIPTMVDFIEAMAEKTGLPVGIKSAVGKLELWKELADYMLETGKGPDFITIDGGEGGTGAAPPSFADHVSLPFVYGFSKIYRIFQKRGLVHRITFIASGKLGLPESAVMAFAMGADLINVGREAMLSIGCIQAQICHTNRCPSGVATQSKWLQNGIDPALKSERFYNYIKTLTKEILEISHASGYEHPCQFTMKDVNLAMGDNNMIQTLADAYGYRKDEVAFTSIADLLKSPYMDRASH